MEEAAVLGAGARGAGGGVCEAGLLRRARREASARALERRALREGVETARAAAEELSRGGAAVSEPETRLRLSLRPAEGTAAELAAALLADTPGVELAWRVSVDGVDIGLAADRSAFEETVLAYIAERAPAESLSTSLASELELRGVFIPEGRATPLAELTGRLRALTAVAYVAADGQTRFA